MKNRRNGWWVVLWVLCASVQAEESWRFINVADWHWAERYVWQKKYPARFQDNLDLQRAQVSTLKNLFGGELMILPGDSNEGHWDEEIFRKRLFPELSPEETILAAGRLCYGGMNQVFREGGYPILLMAVGDHEMGDNPWPTGSVVSVCQPQFREAFSKGWNTNPEDGTFRFADPIGNVPSQPLGTPFEETSYAYRYKNVLFVTVDAFYQKDPNVEIGVEGSVTGAVTGEHLEWLDRVLAAGRSDASIKHIFVQAHLPVIYPVRKVSSSGMLMDDGPDCEFWQTLRKHQVDIYFAGEVHANTVTKDPQSDLLQIVTRGNFFNNITTVDVGDERIEITLHNQLSEKIVDGEYEQIGRLVIDKSGSQTTFEDEGYLAFLDPKARLLHFAFEETVALKDRPILALTSKKIEQGFARLRGVECTDIFVNTGAFGDTYNALQAGVEFTKGVHGNAALMDEASRMGIWALGPAMAHQAISYSLWMKTTSSANQLLVNTASSKFGTGEKFLNLNLNDGRPEVMISADQMLTAQTPKLNDDQWHHITVVMPHDACLLSTVKIYVDGAPVRTQLSGADQPVFIEQFLRMGFGGLGYSHEAFDALPVKPFVGAMDDASVWGRSLSDSEVATLAD